MGPLYEVKSNTWLMRGKSDLMAGCWLKMRTGMVSMKTEWIFSELASMMGVKFSEGMAKIAVRGLFLINKREAWEIFEIF